MVDSSKLRTIAEQAPSSRWAVKCYLLFLTFCTASPLYGFLAAFMNVQAINDTYIKSPSIGSGYPLKKDENGVETKEHESRLNLFDVYNQMLLVSMFG